MSMPRSWTRRYGSCFRGLDEEAADAELAMDRDLLERWLKDKPEHPAHWILGFLLSPDLATLLNEPATQPPRGPEMLFEAPNGWKVKAVPFRLDLEAGRLIGSIMAIDESTFGLLQLQREQAAKISQPGVQATMEVSDVLFRTVQREEVFKPHDYAGPVEEGGLHSARAGGLRHHRARHADGCGVRRVAVGV